MDIENFFREESARIRATLIRLLGDFELAEEAMQDAFLVAVERWPLSGEPDNPRAWIIATARHKGLDRLRRRARFSTGADADALARAEADDADDAPGGIDDRLRLLFTCCHPALAVEAQVALALRTLLDLTTEEIASAFLTPPATLAQRLVRAKRKIRIAGIPYAVPGPEDYPQRLEGVLGAIYLIFNEGYGASAGESLQRTALCDEAIRLGRLLRELLPGEPEAAGLLSLMLLHDARRAARTDAAGDLVLLEDQDRSLWNRPQIERALPLVEAALRPEPPGPPGPFALQAAIAALHAEAASAEQTDWPQIHALYRLLEMRQPSPVVSLNRVVAGALAALAPRVKESRQGVTEPAAAVPESTQGVTEPAPGAAESGLPAAGAPDPLFPEASRRAIEIALGELETLEAAGGLERYRLLPAARADLLRRLGRPEQAAASYRRARDLAVNSAERRYLERRIGEMTAALREPEIPD